MTRSASLNVSSATSRRPASSRILGTSAVPAASRAASCSRAAGFSHGRSLARSSRSVPRTWIPA
ncbi:hypothetical protein SGRIM128S_00401 [Streptomyces griseomycini]